ncbi:DNA-directed RNA polymerase I subunit RPA43-like [Asterias rubens]|uniref:DNA-directed RNA polymerase I subunit RPA43-like n=1 Tax=Asterias rubens TaxID=7604 RepID=UPI0014555C8A|nr:DNA-directed RNA polymerase I subunit RPA43-like [Asterias rubens]
MSALEVFDSFENVAKAAEKEENSGCSLVKTRRHIALSPKYIGRLRTGVHEILDAELGRFEKRWNGVLLAYGNLKLLQSSGAIVDDSPFIYFDVELEAVIFKPSIGSILKCVVNELATDHIGCLVHDWFNVSLLPDKKQINGEWQPQLEPGNVVLVQVEQLRVMNGMLAIEAKEPYNGFGLSQDSKLVVDIPDGLLPPTAAGMESSEKRKKKKKKEKSGSDVASVQGSSNHDKPNAVLALQAGEKTIPKKKSKKRKLLETSMESSEGLALNDVTTGKETSQKKKKKKYSDETIESSVAAVAEDSAHKVPEKTGGETSPKKKKKKKSDKDKTRQKLMPTPNSSNLNVEVKTVDLKTPTKNRKRHSSSLYSCQVAGPQTEAFTKLKKKGKLNDSSAKSARGLLPTDSQCELPVLADEAGPKGEAKKKKKKSKHDRNDNELKNNLDHEASVKEEHASLKSLTSGSKVKNHKKQKSKDGLEIAGNGHDGVSKKKKKIKKKDAN